MQKLPLYGLITLLVLGLLSVALSKEGIARAEALPDQTIAEITTPISESPAHITIVDNRLETRTELPGISSGATVAEVLAMLGFELAPEDVVFPAVTEPAPVFSRIMIGRAPGVEIAADGKRTQLKTRAMTVEALLAEKSITLDDNDRVEPEKTAAITPNMLVKVIRVDVKEEKEKETIAFETKIEDDATKYVGEEAVKTEGANGELEKKFKVTLEDGKSVERELVEEKKLKEPVTKIVLRGTKPKPAPSKPAAAVGPATGKYADLINAAAAKYGVNAQELYRVMMCESGGYKWAVDASKTYYGLFQFRKDMYKAGPYGDRDIFDEEGQIMSAAYYWSIGRRSAWGC
jgi:hypothetical protein